jgi:hypothetical protein
MPDDLRSLPFPVTLRRRFADLTGLWRPPPVGGAGRFAQEIFDLRIDTAQIVRRPPFQDPIQIFMDPEKKSLFDGH